ncbi:MAG TPA: hypothetical protein VH138_12000 [Vicinamibacterales bacterium]|jgi:thymidylate kinase|nr:hypothetical protein [Vicinamibacterales bacterium]
MKRGRLIAIDGIDLRGVRTAARDVIHAIGTPRAGVSVWDASGVFHELTLVRGTASPRTLMVLYAADLAFRVRWDIAPALAEGRAVVAAPYVATAMALGRAVGLPATWLANLLRFAPRPTEARIVESDRASLTRASGFLSVACERWAEPAGIDSDALKREIARHLRARR